MEKNKVDFSGLLGLIFNEPNRVSSIDELSYADAVILIQECNKLNRTL